MPEDDLVHFVIEAVDRLRLPLKSFRVNHRGTGAKQFPPHMMLALLIYSYANGLFSSRKIERPTYRDVAIRHLSAGTHPDHETICKFLRDNLEAFQESFVDVLGLARELKLRKLDKVSLDGTHLKANASIDKNANYERAVEIREQLRLDIAELLAQAEAKYEAKKAEPVFGIIKAVMGFRGFSLRGKEKVSGEWTLVCLAYNLKRLHRMAGFAKSAAGGPISASMIRNPDRNSLVGDSLVKMTWAITKRLTALTAEPSQGLSLTPTHS